MPRARLFLAAALLASGLAGCSHRTVVAPGTIAFLGDSITAGYGLDPGQAYPELVQIPGMTTLNLGVSGSTSADGLERLRAYFDGGDRPSLVVIALGANDILHGVAPAETRANLTAAIAACRDHGAAVLLCGVRIPFNFGTGAIFEDVSRASHVPLMPDILQGEAFHEELMQEDHMHPTAEGQRKIAEKMQAALRQHFSFARWN